MKPTVISGSKPVSQDDPYYDVHPLDVKFREETVAATSISGLSAKLQEEIKYLDNTIAAVRRTYDKRVEEIQQAAVVAVQQQTDASNELLAELENMRKSLLNLL